MGTRLYQVKVTANARKSEVIFESETQLRIKVPTAPEKGKANEKVIELLAKELKIPKKKITIKSGEFNKNKVIAIED